MPLWRQSYDVLFRPRVAAIAASTLAVLLTLPGLAPGAAQAEVITSSHRDTFGEVGLLEMPSARMAPDSQLAATFGGINAGQHATLSFQFLPWFGASFRYSRTPKLYGGDILYDRSFGLKLRLFQETRYTPDIAIGMRDVVGTGIYGSEYLVATKRIGDFDVTAGLGWGRMAGNGMFENPLTVFSNSFKTRKPVTGPGGNVDFGQLFHGPDTGLFGGVVWHTPIKNLDLMAEYSSDNYAAESAAGSIKVRAPVNIGLSYVPIQGFSLTAGWFYGSTFGAVMTFDFDPTTAFTRSRTAPPPKRPVTRPYQAQTRAIGLYVNGHSRGPGFDAVVHRAERPPMRSAFEGRRPEGPMARLTDALGPTADVEIDGNTLLISMHAEGRGQVYCRNYAQLATQLHIGTVAITDLDRTNGRVAICSASQFIRASVTMPI